MAKKNLFGGGADTLDADDPLLPGETNVTVDLPSATVTSTSPASSAEKRTPAEWAEKLGYVEKRDPRIPQSITFYKMAHAVADKLHGWSAHEHHFQGAPLILTRADYEAALDAAVNQTSKVVAPHEAALSPASQIARARAKAANASKAKKGGI